MMGIILFFPLFPLFFWPIIFEVKIENHVGTESASNRSKIRQTRCRLVLVILSHSKMWTTYIYVYTLFSHFVRVDQTESNFIHATSLMDRVFKLWYWIWLELLTWSCCKIQIYYLKTSQFDWFEEFRFFFLVSFIFSCLRKKEKKKEKLKRY